MQRTTSYKSGLNYLPLKQHKKEILRDRELIFLFKKVKCTVPESREGLKAYILKEYSKK